MHSPFDSPMRPKTEQAIPSRRQLGAAGLPLRSWSSPPPAAYFERGTLYDWIAGPRLAATILVSGNIEAHQSVLGFKTVQSRIVELPFDEGQWVDRAR